jgi:hypothetical protein
LAAVLMAAGCFNSGKKKLNQRITLWRGDDIPYGTHVAYENLGYIFPGAEIVINKKSPDRYKSIDLRDLGSYNASVSDNEVKSAWIIIAPGVIPDNNEVNALLNYVGRGNSIFISAFRLGGILLDSLRLKTALPNGLYNDKDSLQVSVYRPVGYDSVSYAYPGFSGDNFITRMDSAVTTILGYNSRGEANFVRLSYKGGGNMFIHLAPIALTNFFLLHKDNKQYYDEVFSYLPANTEKLLWDDYFRYNEKGSRRNFSALSFLVKFEAFRWALGLVLLLFALLFILGSKRRQRVIPAMAPLRNSSLDFVKTVGRLYFQRRDNKNLARKLAAHFLEQVRGKYGISTAQLDEEFVNRLALKSGRNRDAVADIVYSIKTIDDFPVWEEDELMRFNGKLEAFYQS